MKFLNMLIVILAALILNVGVVSAIWDGTTDIEKVLNSRCQLLRPCYFPITLRHR